jgi:hypothetical protein
VPRLAQLQLTADTTYYNRGPQPARGRSAGRQGPGVTLPTRGERPSPAAATCSAAAPAPQEPIGKREMNRRAVIILNGK